MELKDKYMNLKRLQEMQMLESKIDDYEASKAAKMFPLEFKQELVRTFKNEGFNVNKEKTFKSSSTFSKANPNNKLYNKYGSVSSGSLMRQDPKYPQKIEIILYNTFSSNDDDEIKISISPKTSGSIEISTSLEHRNSKEIDIIGKKSRVFFKDIISAFREIIEMQTKSEKKRIDPNEIIKNYVENSIDGVDAKVKKSGYGYNSPEKLYITANENNISKQESIGVNDISRTLSFLSNVFEKPSIKSAYKKATGESAGKKGDRYTISGSFNSKRIDVYDSISFKNKFSILKKAVLDIYSYAKSQNIYISNIDRSSYINGSFEISFLGDDEEYDERGRKRKKKSFNVYKYLMNMKNKIDEIDEIDSANKFIEEKCLPISRKIIGQLFEE